jgi:signal peptidase I
MAAKDKHGYETHPTITGKIWHFLAHEDSAASFIVDAIIVLIIGKLVVLPLLGLALGTPFPMVAVVSGSMEHKQNCFDCWWTPQESLYKDFNITKEQFMQFPHHNGFNKGDVFIVRGAKLEDIKIGDIIVYNIPEKSDPIIHRVVEIKPNILVTKGDANNGQLSFELEVHRNQLKGIAKYKIPYLGWFKVALIDLGNLITRR